MISARTLTFRDQALLPIWEKVKAGERLTLEDGLTLFNSPDLIGVGRMANEVARAKSGDSVYFVLNRKLEPTNVCVLSCKFCDFAVKAGADDAYEMTIDDMLSKLRPDLHEVHITAGLHPKWPWEFYIDMVKTIKTRFPNVDVKAFTAVEIDYFSRKFKKSHEQVLTELQEAGLRTMPGGGAEVFSERVRKLLFKQKIGAKTWFDVHKQAHRMGINSNVTLLYGHVETLQERVEHMIQVREVQDETNGFLSFIPLAFQPGNTGIKTRNAYTSAVDDLKTIAVSRLMLDNIPHIKAYWVMLTAEVATIALNFGADDMDGTVGEERIAHDAGATSPMELAKNKLISIIHDAGKLPVERDVWYNPIEVYPAEGTKVVSKMPYLNSAAFYSFFRPSMNEIKVAPLVPSVLGKFADEGTVSAGPMSLCDYFDLSDKFTALPYGISTNGKSHSVHLHSHFEFDQLEGKTIGVTGQTSTSVKLLRVLLEKKYGIKNYKLERLHLTSSRNQYTKYDAVLLIGDEALARTKMEGFSTFLNRYDLAEEWTNWKQMPFVFATWAVGNDVSEEQRAEIVRNLESSLDQSKGHFAEIGREHGKKLGMTGAEVENYLNAYQFRFGDAQQRAIDEFNVELLTLGELEISKVEA